MRFNNAFTLIELLIVIAIISIVAAILFPVFACAKVAAKKTMALSNLKQIGSAAHLYLNDYDDKTPFHFPEFTSWPGYNVILLMTGPGFTAKYQPYISNKDVWFSPCDRLKDKGFTSFTFNGQLAYSWQMSAIPRPAEAIYATDRTDIELDRPPVDTYVWWRFTNQMPFKETSLPGKIDPISVASQIDPIRYSGDLGLYLFLDGHAAAMPFDRTWGDATHNLHLATKP